MGLGRPATQRDRRATAPRKRLAKDGAVIGIEARMVPANDQLYVDIEKALSQDDVREMVVPPGTPADVAVATKGERKAYVCDERAGATESGRRLHGARGRGGP